MDQFQAQRAERARGKLFPGAFVTQKELLEELFVNYDHLYDDLKAELPLKRIWTVAIREEE